MAKKKWLHLPVSDCDVNIYRDDNNDNNAGYPINRMSQN